MKRRTNATNSTTNKPNKDHPVPLRATQGHQSTTKRHVKFPVIPRALKLLKRPIRDRDGNHARKGRGTCGRVFGHDGTAGRQGRAGGAPFCGRGACVSDMPDKLGVEVPCAT